MYQWFEILNMVFFKIRSEKGAGPIAESKLAVDGWGRMFQKEKRRVQRLSI